jgi:LPS O-antigen subunit length determinant protein (WzzB/FepE family)
MHATREPMESRHGRGLSDVDFFELWGIAWAGRWLIGVVTAAFAVFSVVFALLLPNIYRAETVLVPVQPESGLGDLTALAGRVAGLSGLALGAGSDMTQEALATIRSRAFTEQYIQANGLLPQLFPDLWDSQRRDWNVSDPEERPTLWTGFEKLDEVRAIEFDQGAGTVTVSVEWPDPALATAWVNGMVAALNRHLQQRAIAESERNRQFLEAQIAATNVVEIKEVLYRLLETQIRTIVLAQGRPEYAFKVVGKALVPEKKSKPWRSVICIAITLLGGLLSTAFVLIRHAHRSRRGQGVSAAAG